MKTFWKSFKITVAFCILLSMGYILILWIFAQAAGPNRGEADIVVAEGRTVVGCWPDRKADVVVPANVGQSFTEAKYFWGRPSAVDYNGGGSGGSNKATTNPEYLAEIEARIDTFLAAHPYLTRKDVPSEIVTASGSGLDPDISPAAAYVQVKRVADARGLSEETVRTIVEEQVQQPWHAEGQRSETEPCARREAIQINLRKGRNPFRLKPIRPEQPLTQPIPQIRRQRLRQHPCKIYDHEKND